MGILILLFDGYDLFVFGAVAPVLLEYEAWNVTPALVGLIGSLPPLRLFGFLEVIENAQNCR